MLGCQVKYKEVFDFFDVNKSGSIDKVEFFVALQKLGLMVPIGDDGLGLRVGVLGFEV